MKKLLQALCFAICFMFVSNLYSQTITIDTYANQEPAQGEYDKRVPAKSFEVNGANVPVYFKYELDGNGAWETHPLNLIVVKDDGTVAYNYSFDPGGSSGIYYANSTFPEGNYTAKIVEGSDESSVWCKKEFTVGAAMTKVAGSKNVIFCDYVDDNWNPIGAVTSIKAGQCVNFMVSLPQTNEKIPIIGWEIYKVKKDGTDGAFVSEMSMAIDNPDAYTTKFATTQKLCEFDKPGKYRIYAINWYERQVNNAIGNFQKYYAKGELTVE